jgi:outer membrane protein assembly factor BamE (lipoprotein component of BamABCDE complex)
VGLSPAELERAAADIAPGTGAAQVRARLGDPLVESALSDGGQTWLYVKADPDHGQHESLAIAFDARGGFKRVERKAVD